MTVKAEQKLVGGSGTDTQSYNAGSLTTAANALILAGIVTEHASAADVPTMTTTGLTWVQVRTDLFDSNTRRITILRAMGAVTGQTVTVNVGGSANIGCLWDIWQFENVDTSGTHGSGAVGDTDHAAGSAASIAATITQSKPHNPIVAWATKNNANAIVPEWADYEEQVRAGTNGSHSTPARVIASQYRHDGFQDTSPSFTEDGVTARQWGSTAVEIIPDPAKLTVILMTLSFDNTNGSTYATSSIAAHEDHLLIGAVVNGWLFGPGTQTVSSSHGTWVQDDSTVFAVGHHALRLWRTMPSSDVTDVIDMVMSSGSNGHAAWAFYEIGNVDTSGTNGSGAIVQTDTASSAGTTPSVTLSSFADSHNGVVAFIGAFDGAVTFTPGTGFTSSGYVYDDGPDILAAQFRDDNDTSVNATLSTSEDWAIIAAEIKWSSGITSTARSWVVFV